MSEDSWAVAVDVQEATTPSIQIDFSKKVDRLRGPRNIRGDINGNIVPERAENGGWTRDGDKVDLAEQSLLNKLIRRSLVRNRNQVEVLQRDPTSPLYSVKTFEELRLKPELLKGVYNMGFNRPSRIQENALPMMLAQPPQNLIAQSQSGTGKTAAFSLAMLSHVNPAKKWTQCLCISPTYELALQIGQVIEQMGKFCPDVKLAYGIRGSKMERGTKLQQQIVIGTPGTILDWCTKYKLIDPKKITMFVLDEADVMIATQGHRDQSIRIHRQLTKDCQMLLFSATFEDSVWKFAEHVVPDPNIIRLKREEETLDTIKQFYVVCKEKEDKFTALCNLYGTLTIAQAMIFCHTRKMAAWLTANLTKEGHQVALLSGEMTVEQRAAVIERFRNGKEKVLVTTNVCSRGIDVEQVSLVVNFDLPVDMDGNADNETYLHRIGRTGRFGRRGFAVNMVDSKHSMDIINQIEMHFNRRITKLDTSNLEEMESLIS
ncbi:ATP-dependent RNA helicase DDX19A [Micropterus salmoides]|uniref:ATP-dependent RNA helicase DDX19A n=1 Tax=Micropterus salmoides TaxID=27706 RepID=UPI0018EA4C43|nr:ATP-dependent RNA helicase DDX19A [Micropterus salmoides]XP_045912400.1 ATP-dependent RNA helicase DDX19A [Micropterus dolomieu]